MTHREAAKLQANFFELDSNFFFDLPMKSSSRRFNGLLDTTTGKPNLSRPRVAFPLRPLQEECLQSTSRFVPEKNRDNRFSMVAVA
jgi:hypothetical protein